MAPSLLMPPLFLPLSSKGEASLVYFTTHSWNVSGMVFSAIAAFDIRNDPGSQISVCWDVVPSEHLCRRYLPTSRRRSNC